jgi:hypothetical protein
LNRHRRARPPPRYTYPRCGNKEVSAEDAEALNELGAIAKALAENKE